MRYLLSAPILFALAVTVAPRSPVSTDCPVAVKCVGDTARGGRDEGRTSVGGSITVAKTPPG